MIYVLISVLCSVTVSVLLKFARNQGLDTSQIIVWNYPVAAGLTFLFFTPQIEFLTHPDAPWGIYLLLAVLLPSVFFALGASLRTTGLVRTEIAQRLSLIIPLIAAFYWFGETASTGTWIGLGMCLLAIGLSIGWHKEDTGKVGQVGQGGRASSISTGWLYPLLVFIGYGICDVLFKSIAQITSIPYTTSMFFVFVMAMLVAFLYLILWSSLGKIQLSVRAIAWGLVLGAFNFANILFYMRAHRALPDNPSIVFTGMNIGVISLGALVGVLVFREKLSTLNKIGLVLAMVSILVLAAFI